MLNKVLLTGRLVADPEIVETKTGTPVTKLRVAVDRKGREKETDFFDATAFNRTAEFASTYLDKGRMIALVGQLRVRSYQANDGTNRKVWEIVVDEVHPLDSRKTNSETAAGVPNKTSYTSGSSQANDEFSIEDPFAE
jgi:single-strand DNA-binding protein